MGTERGQSLRMIGLQLEETWQQRLDRPASRPLAYEACLAVQGGIDPVRDHDGVVAAVQFLWDAEDDLISANALVETWRRRVHEVTHDWAAVDALAPRVRALLLQARLAFRANEYEEARTWAEAAVKQLRLTAGGDAALRRVAVGPRQTTIGELYCAYLAIEIPIIRMDRANWPTMRQLHDLDLRDALSIITSNPNYDRLPALVTQTFFALAARDDCLDAATVDWLADVDSSVRAHTKRAQCMRLLMDMTLANYHGDAEAEHSAATAAADEFRKAGFLRLIRALNSRGWWRLRPAA